MILLCGVTGGQEIRDRIARPVSAPAASGPSSTRWVIPPEIAAAEKRIVRITSQIFDEKTQSYQDQNSGTGVIERTGRVITCEHMEINWEGRAATFVNGGLSREGLKFVDRILVNGMPAIVVGFNHFDVMVISVVTDEFPPLEWEVEVVKTEPVTQIGNPGGLERTITSGTIINTLGDVFFIDAQTLPGNSGSILINRYGKAIGMVFAKLPFSEIDRFGYVRPARMILNVLNELENRNAYANLTDPKHTPVEIK
jgi:hypothetical protein